MTSAIATRLRELRHRLGFNRRSDMAHHLGLPSSTYSAYEADAGPPKVEWLVELARRGVNLNWLLTGDGEMMTPPGPIVSTEEKRVGATGGGSREAELDIYLLAAMIRRVEREEQGRDHALTALEKGEMIARLYAASARLTETELAGHPSVRAAEGPER